MKHVKDGKLVIYVKAGALKTEILGWDEDKEALRVAIKEQPEKSKANIAIVKLFTKISRQKVTIVSGRNSSKKVLKFS